MEDCCLLVKEERMENPINKESENLWIDYYKTRDLSVRNQIILKYVYLVKHVVNKMWGSYSHLKQMEDLVSCGVLGLIDAIERYDLSRGVKFETYAYFRIRGEIIDQIRKSDWIPKNVRMQSKKIEQTMAFLEDKLGRQPSEQEIADHMLIKIEDLKKFLGQCHSLSVVSLDEHVLDATYGSALLADKAEAPERLANDNEMKEVLTNAIETLTDKEKMVVSLYYFEEMNLKEIGVVLGVSESRVSQIHTKALLRMKNRLMRHKEAFFEEEHE
jgi:RNA polymerase sigma factor for flagellar operon FliA